MNVHVDEIIVEDGRAVGVRLKNGNVVKAKQAVVSNATPFDTVKMLGQSFCSWVITLLHQTSFCASPQEPNKCFRREFKPGARNWASYLATVPSCIYL